MLCGNDPRAVLTDRDVEVVEWFKRWLEWGASEERDPDDEPKCPPWKPVDVRGCKTCA